MATMLLLDTHILLWLFDDSPRLGAEARARLAAASTVHFSAATIWELTIKALLGKLEVPPDLVEECRTAGLLEMPVTALQAARVAAFPTLVRHDPFDRILLAQAVSSGCELITANAILLAIPHAPVIDGRH